MNNAAKYTLSLRNRGGRFVRFAIFQTYGEVADIAVKPLPLAWMVGSVAPGGKSEQSVCEMSWKTARNISLIGSHHIGNDMFSANSVVMPAGSIAESGCAVAYMGDFPFGAPAFVGSVVDDEKGFFLIQTDATIPPFARQHGENCFLKIGLSMAGRQVSVADLHPETHYRFSLEPVYRIVAGEFFPGQIIEEQEVEKSYRIDFGQEINKTIIIKEDGSFTDEK
ncbi:MAG: hypothetical protein LBS35_14735 [Synergistaceae bacterium]|jgi:hypothetical protein|nr:hypothetical protein [Synergistaceae bacterium]